jgi:hypothetical protein
MRSYFLTNEFLVLKVPLSLSVGERQNKLNMFTKALVENVALIIDVVCYDLKFLPYHLMIIFKIVIVLV